MPATVGCMTCQVRSALNLITTRRNQARLCVLGDGLHDALRAGEAGRVERLAEAADGLRRGRHHALLLLLAGQLLRLVQLLPQLVVPAEAPSDCGDCSLQVSWKQAQCGGKPCGFVQQLCLTWDDVRCVSIHAGCSDHAMLSWITEL